MKPFWPVAEAAQADYERLRHAVMSSGRLPDDVVSARFRRRGLAGLIAWPDAEDAFWAQLIGATRPAWTPHGDPRIAALACTYRFLLDAADNHRQMPGVIVSGNRR